MRSEKALGTKRIHRGGGSASDEPHLAETASGASARSQAKMSPSGGADQAEELGGFGGDALGVEAELAEDRVRLALRDVDTRRTEDPDRWADPTVAECVGSDGIGHRGTRAAVAD